jgi:alkylated DNA repair dioxygenase AlkB
MFGKTMMQPRFSCVFANDGIIGQRYSGQMVPALPWTDLMREMRDQVINDGFNPTACLINGYCDVSHYVSYHRDKNLNDGRNTVATISIGGSRTFAFRRYDNHEMRASTILNSGDIVYFWGRTNEIYEHSILKPKKGELCNVRYSLTFRVIDDN